MMILELSGIVCISYADSSFYPSYIYYSESIPGGAIIDEEGYSQGTLFRTPAWLLSRLDQGTMSTVLDRGPIPTQTENPPSFDGYISEGNEALEGGNFRVAYTAFKKAVEMEPSSSDALYGLGLTLENQKRYLSALDAYAKAINAAKGDSSNWASYAGKGRVCYALNRFDDAKIALETAIAQYEKAGVTSPDNLEEMTRLLNELEQKLNVKNTNPISAYIPSMVSGISS